MTKKITALLVAAAILALPLALSGCAAGPSRQAYQGGAVGAGVGGLAGAMIDRKNSWRGGVIGAGLGAVLGGALGEIGNRAAQEAAYQQRPVVYTNAPGTHRVEAMPSGNKGNCHIVKEKYYERGQLVKETEREVCN